MAHERIEIDLPLAKVYELLSNPVYFPNFMERIDEVEKVNSNLRNTRFAWITINGNLNQTGTLRFTPLDNGERTRVDFSLDYRTFYGEPEEDLAKFIEELPEQIGKDLARFKEMAEAGTFREETDESGETSAEEKEVTV